RGVTGAGAVPRAVLCSAVQHLVLQVQPGDGLAASAGGGGAAPFRRRTHGVVGLELAGGRAPRGVGFVASGAVVRHSLLCHPPFPSRPCLLLWAGRQPCDGEEQRIWLLSGDVW
ncbi:hypothetical protein ACJX0J_012308, partial [Zea mays]